MYFKLKKKKSYLKKNSQVCCTPTIGGGLWERGCLPQALQNPELTPRTGPCGHFPKCSLLIFHKGSEMSGEQRILALVLTSPLCLLALSLAGIKAPFMSNPDVLLFP